MVLLLGVVLGDLSADGAAPPNTPPEAARFHGKMAPLVVVSDIDDTIKNTGVTIGRSHIKNLPWLAVDPVRPWRPVPGMAQLYRGFQNTSGAKFYYVSKGPPFNRHRLERALNRYRFPEGQICLNADFPFAAASYKCDVIAPIIEHDRRAHYLLIGDSGETDPESYGMLARKFPRQIDHILIRNITNDRSDRYQSAFRGILRSKWTLFVAPSDVDFPLFPKGRR